MPGILPMKVIRVGSSAPARIAQACDRCRSKKIRCDGLRPTCSQCSNVGFECKTSDKLSRRAFPRGYTESLEERVRALENETRELKDLLDNREEKIDVLSKVQSGSPSRRASNDAVPSPCLSASVGKAAATVSVEQPRHLHSGPGHDPLFVGNSSTRSLADALIQKLEFSGRPCDNTKSDRLLHFQSPARPSVSIANEAWKPPPRLVTDQMVNVFFQEWAPLFPVLHRPSFLTIYESYVTHPQRVPDRAAQVQLNLVFGIAALSNKQRITYDMGIIDTHWLNILDAFVKQTTFANLQCFVLAQLYCLQTGDYTRLNYYRSQSVAMALSMGLHQSQASFALGTLVCESRKKVFWSIYCLDRFTAAILGQPLSISDDIIECEYPANVDDEYISDQGIQPVLPGELTKLSSALELFKAVRILSRILKRLYPTSTTYEVSLEEVEDLEGELDRWLSDLPTHLHMQFVNDKPAAQSVNSRSPILLLAYHYIRSLILRPLATSLDCEHSCASTLALASSGKTTVQILRLLEERNLSFAFCVNRFDLLTSCGCNLLLEMLDLDLEHDSALHKDFRWELCTVVDMLSRHAAPSLPDFKHLACTVLPARRSTSTTTETPAPSSLFGASPELAVSLSPCDTTSPHSDAVLDSSSAVDARRGGSGAPSKSRTASSASLPAKKFRLIAPSTQRRRPSEGGSTSTRAPTKTPSLCDSASSVKSVKSPGVNLDYFVIPPDHVRSAVPCSASSERPSSAAHLRASPSSPCWDRLFEGMSHAREGREDLPNRLHLDERGAGPEMEGEWPTFTDLLSPLQEHGGAAAVASPRVGGGKSHSMVSFSGDSLASSDELGTYDFVAVDGDSDAVIGAAAAAAATALADEGEDSPMDGIALEV